ncbi:unnamed protein product [Vitrella brassicaformis CCMP3155]|uniref:Mitochondrial import inner membrane translocase subunit TIM50 n=2 Tax=Vitrella brassicaformis TaxID=1169539 RepID=A0A0G4G2R7_VITBC|nr:unnamed protein product [Vitrella brassicaformis CCMP3155]|eukprot:CEM22482.1 unnamed protein product [Vitrella brassicaformis CCMP3155]
MFRFISLLSLLLVCLSAKPFDAKPSDAVRSVHAHTTNATTTEGLTMYVDVDETLIYARDDSNERIEGGILHFPHPYYADEDRHTLLRHHVVPFLKKVKSLGVKMYIWTAAMPVHADPAVDKIEELAGERLFLDRFYRDTKKATPSKQKDVGYPGLPTRGDVSHAILLDDNKKYGRCQPPNYFPIKKFKGQVESAMSLDGMLFSTIAELHYGLLGLLTDKISDVRCPIGKELVAKWQEYNHSSFDPAHHDFTNCYQPHFPVCHESLVTSPWHEGEAEPMETSFLAKRGHNKLLLSKARNRRTEQ